MNNCFDFVSEGKLIADSIRSICSQLGVPELFAKIKVEWNGRFTCRMGDAEWNQLADTGLVRFSMPLWPRASVEERANTVAHEVCHIAVYYIYKLWEQHGQKWKHLMRKCGHKGSRCHKVDRTGLRRNHTRTKYKVVCGCREWLVGVTRYRRIKAGIREYCCPYCKENVRSPYIYWVSLREVEANI